MTHPARGRFLQKIRSNIERYGYHVYLISGKQSPRFAYTIGLSPAKGAELILAGAAFYSDDQIKQIIDTLASMERAVFAEGSSLRLEAEDIGSFSLRTVNQSWIGMLIRGALDYYEKADVPALQIVPDDDHSTIDVPDLSRPWSADSEPTWRWLREPWEHGVPDHSVAVTNLEALRGKPITEAVRWEADQWELFAGAGPDVAPEEIREVPLGTLLAVDPSLTTVAGLEVGKGVWRDAGDLRWHDWSKDAEQS